MKNDNKSDITKINEFIEKHSLQKIMKIIYAAFGGLITLIVAVNLMPTKYYDCSTKGTQVVDKVLACEQQKIDERIKEKELELEEYKVKENYKMERLKEIVKSIDLKDPKQILKSLESSTARLVSREMDSCMDKAMKTMCEVKFK